MDQKQEKQEKQEKQPSVNFEYCLEDVYNSIKHLDGGVSIKATEKGLNFRGIDMSNTILTNVGIDQKSLGDYKLEEKEFEINTEVEFLKIVKRMYIIKAYLNEKKMIFEDSGSRFELPVEEGQKNNDKPTDLNLDNSVSFKISTTEVRKALKDIETLGSESFYLTFKGNEAIFQSKGYIGSFLKRVETSEEGIKKYKKSKDSTKVGVSTENFRKALNGMSLSSSIRITLGENSPIIVENEGEYSSLKITHYIAPRVAD